MTDREKLIEILRKPIFPHELVDPTEAVADYLLDNGVTVREPGEWIWHEEEFKYECSACNCRFDYNHTFGIFDHGFEYGSFCPNCGAKMEV